MLVNIIIESDSRAAIELVQEGCETDHPLVPMVSEIREKDGKRIWSGVSRKETPLRTGRRRQRCNRFRARRCGKFRRRSWRLFCREIERWGECQDGLHLMPRPVGPLPQQKKNIASEYHLYKNWISTLWRKNIAQ